MPKILAIISITNSVWNSTINTTLKLYSQPGEAERDFQARMQQAAREAPG